VSVVAETPSGEYTDVVHLNVGPQHPATHGVLRLFVRASGEIVEDVEPDIGYLHRCAEKIGETVPYDQFPPYMDRTDYLAGTNCGLTYCLAVEKLADIEVPERATVIRVIMCEFGRIASHLMAFGAYGMDLGAVTPFLYAFRERETVLDFFEETGGERLTHNYVRIGGVSADFPPGITDRMWAFLEDFERKVRDYNELLTYNRIFIDRTKGLGNIPLETALDYGVTGPVLRACGLKWDLRVDDPYCGYETYDFEVPVGTDDVGEVGDCWNRYYIRIREMGESVKIIRQALGRLSEGSVMTKLGRIRPSKGAEVYVRTECPKGEQGVYLISDGSPTASRCKIRGPSFSTLSAFPEMMRGHMIADIEAVLGSLDLVMGDVDR
jgi:NADH-quinone oxidoreductase subunit D